VTRVVHLHIGTPKSGTTWLQSILDGNRERLAAAGVLVVGERHLDRVQAGLQLREDPRLESLPEHRRAMWDRLVAEIAAWPGERAVLSYELFSAATAEQAARALTDLAAYDVHVVITARDLARTVPSAWQERLKFGLTDPLAAWVPPAAPRSEWGWRTTDPAEVATRWAGSLPPDHLHLVTLPRTRSDETLLWQRFREACALPEVDYDLGVTRANASLGAVGAELLRRVNAELAPVIASSRERSVWLRDLLAHRVLAPLDRTAMAVTPEQYADAEAHARSAIATIRERGWAVHGDLEDLEARPFDGVLPEESSDAQLLDVAVRAIAALVLDARAQEAERSTGSAGSAGSAGDRSGRPGRSAAELARVDAEPTAGHGMRGRAGRMLRRAASPYIQNRSDALEARIAQLEAEVALSRRLQLRVAELTDVVTELLLPAHQRRRDVEQSALVAYRRESL
jgi:hypothetical protein